MDFLQGGNESRKLVEQALSFAKEADNLSALTRLGLAVSSSEVTYFPPVQRPGKIFCLGRNYREHAAEMGATAPDPYPVLFAKFSNTLIGHGAPIVLPKVSQMVDYEAELAVVIGRRAHNVPMESAFDYIAGYTNFNDVSVRDWQKRTQQWLQGKTFDGTGPIGPVLVTLDELKDPQKLGIALRLNGQVMQCANISDFIFNIPTVIHYITQIVTLEPGDVIATGTPSGVGFARKPPIFLKAGDVVEVEIEGLGVLRNPVVAPAEENAHV
jgi:2-keto-4-pentenoate hydratase/2-oxohepta-3-ene-1,7-dioic acid hydratase in catechol pathway